MKKYIFTTQLNNKQIFGDSIPSITSNINREIDKPINISKVKNHIYCNRTLPENIIIHKTSMMDFFKDDLEPYYLSGERTSQAINRRLRQLYISKTT